MTNHLKECRRLHTDNGTILQETTQNSFQTELPSHTAAGLKITFREQGRSEVGLMVFS